MKSWSTSEDADDRPTEEVVFVFAELEESSENSKSSPDVIESKQDISSKTIDPIKENDNGRPSVTTKSIVPEWVQSTANFWIDGNVSDKKIY